MLSKYIEPLKRLNCQLERLKKKTGYPKIYFWCDAFYCYLRHGSSPNDYINFHFFKIKNIERKRFLTLRRLNNAQGTLNDSSQTHIFGDKKLFNERFSSYVNREWLYTPEVSNEEITEFIQRNGKVIAKPTDQSCGRGIFLIRNDREDITEEFCNKLRSKKLLIEQFVEQHPDIAKLNKSTVNTIRVYTLIDRSGRCTLIFAALRVGRDGYVDNFHNGGIGYIVDLETGIITNPGLDARGRQHMYHPTSNILMLGYRIPRWQELKLFVMSAANEIPACRYIGWDVAITERGFEMLEGNSGADQGFLQTLDKVGKLDLIKRAL